MKWVNELKENICERFQLGCAKPREELVADEDGDSDARAEWKAAHLERLNRVLARAVEKAVEAMPHDPLVFVSDLLLSCDFDENFWPPVLQSQYTQRDLTQQSVNLPPSLDKITQLLQAHVSSQSLEEASHDRVTTSARCSGEEVMMWLMKQEWCIDEAHAKAIGDALCANHLIIDEQLGAVLVMKLNALYVTNFRFLIKDLDVLCARAVQSIEYEEGSKHTFSGHAMVSWLVREGIATTREHAVSAATQLKSLLVFHSSEHSVFSSPAKLAFRDDRKAFYRFSVHEEALRNATGIENISHTYLLNVAERMEQELHPVPVGKSLIEVLDAAGVPPRFRGEDLTKWILSEGTARTEAEAVTLVEYMVAAQVLYAVGMRRPQSESLRFAFTAADLQMFSPSFEYSFVGAANLARTAAYRRVQQNVNEGKKSRATAFLQQVVKRRIAIEEHADLGDDLHDFLYSKPAPEEERTKHFKDSHHQEHVHEPTSPPVKKKQRPLGVIRLDYGYPPIPGDIDHPNSFSYPVVYRKVPGLLFEVAQEGILNDEICEGIKKAVEELEAHNVFGITGDCGFMANYQAFVRSIASCPVFLSSLVLLPQLLPLIGRTDRILCCTANGKSLSKLFPAIWGAPPPPPAAYELTHRFTKHHMDLRFLLPQQLVVCGFERVPGFDAVAEASSLMSHAVDRELVEKGITSMVLTILSRDPSIKMILFECTELPHYSVTLRQATGLPVFDSLSICNFVHESFNISKDEAAKRSRCLGHHCQINFPDTPASG